LYRTHLISVTGRHIVPAPGRGMSRVAPTPTPAPPRRTARVPSTSTRASARVEAMASSSASARFATVATGIVPPLPDDDADADAELDVAPDDGRWNLAKATLAAFPERYPTLTAARKAVRRGELRVDGVPRKGDYRVAAGAAVSVVARVSSGDALDVRDLPSDLPRLEIAYEDNHMAVIVKPEGMPSVGDGAWNAERALPYYLRETRRVEGALSRPRPVHRLDAATSGLLVCAKTRLAMTSLSVAFARREPKKRYRAVLAGAAGGWESGSEGVADAPLEGKPCVTRWRVDRVAPCSRHGRVTLMDFAPETGRTHQLRRHAAESLRCPIVGDFRYTKKSDDAFGGLDDRDGLFLAAVEISLPPSATPWINRGGEGAFAGEGEGGDDDDDDDGWLRVRIDDPEKFARRLGDVVVA